MLSLCHSAPLLQALPHKGVHVQRHNWRRVSLGRRGLPRLGDAGMSRGTFGDQPGVSQLVSTACCSTVIYYFVVTKSPKTLLNNTCQATATANLPSSSQGCGRCGVGCPPCSRVVRSTMQKLGAVPLPANDCPTRRLYPSTCSFHAAALGLKTT
jgi:hypothetical protein